MTPSVEHADGLGIAHIEAVEHRRHKLDVRGLLLCWRKPDPHSTYYMGIDPTRGITGWNRDLRLQQDKNIDNGVIEVLRLGRRGEPDEQVAEYAAPIDTLDLARVAAKVGRLYSGTSDRGCMAIVETTGVGITTQEEMLRRYHYYNMYIWEKLGSTQGVQRTTVYGWQASKDSNLALWLKCHRHMDQKRVLINSPWLVDECADATSDWVTAQVRAKWGAHDDRLRAFFLSIWAAHSWSYADEDATDLARQDEPARNLAATDLTVDEMGDTLDEEWDRLMPHERM